MKRIQIILLVTVLAVGGIVGGIIIVNNGGSKYDQSSPAATAKSFITAMINGDSEGFATLTKDIIPWYYMVSDLLSYSTQNMIGTSISDYYYYQQGNRVVVYKNKDTAPEYKVYDSGYLSGKTGDFFCMEFVATNADGKGYKFCIVELVLPGGFYSEDNSSEISVGVNDWGSIMQAAIDNGCTRFK